MATQASRSCTSREGHVCEMCEDGTIATCKCIDCDQVCCESCAQSHGRIKATRSHAVVTVSQEVSAPEKLCETHKDEKLRFYCSVCRLVICRDCKLTQHEGHATSDISQVSGKAKMSLKEVAPLLKSLQPWLKIILQEAVQYRSGVLQKKKDIASTLRQRADLLKAEIDICLAAAEKQLSKESGDVDVAIDSNVKEMTQKSATLDDLVGRANCVLKSGGNADLLQLPKQIGEFVGNGQGVPTTVASGTFGHNPGLFGCQQINPRSNLKVFTNNEWRLDLQLANQDRQQAGFSYPAYPANNAHDQPFTIPQPLKTQIANCIGTVIKVTPISNRQVAPAFYFNQGQGQKKKSQYDTAVYSVEQTATQIQQKLNGWV